MLIQFFNWINNFISLVCHIWQTRKLKKESLRLWQTKGGKMVVAKKVGKYIRDIFEVYIPCIVFLIMFVVFILQIFFRYIMNDPLTWTVELTLVCFCWIVTLGACFAARKKSHVMFTLIYDSMGHVKKHICSIAGNVIIISAFLIMLFPSYEFVSFMNFQSTSVLKINMTLVFFPFLVLLIDVIVYQTIELIESIVSIKRGEDIELIDRSFDTEFDKYLANKKKIKVEGGMV